MKKSNWANEIRIADIFARIDKIQDKLTVEELAKIINDLDYIKFSIEMFYNDCEELQKTFDYSLETYDNLVKDLNNELKELKNE